MRGLEFPSPLVWLGTLPFAFGLKLIGCLFNWHFPHQSLDVTDSSSDFHLGMQVGGFLKGRSEQDSKVM